MTATEGGTYRLNILLKGEAETLSILGARDNIRDAMDVWQAYKEACDTSEVKVLVVEGFMDTADRAEQRSVVPLDEIRSVTMVQMY